MVTVSLIDESYRQEGDICAIASYWIVLSYFSRHRIGLYEIAENLRDNQLINYVDSTDIFQLENNIGRAFNNYCRERRNNIRGYQFIREIHDLFYADICTIVLQSWWDIYETVISQSVREAVVNILAAENALALITYKVEGRGYHSILIGVDENRCFFKRDTNCACVEHIDDLPSNILEILVFKER